MNDSSGLLDCRQEFTLERLLFSVIVVHGRFVLWCSGCSHRFAARRGDALFVSFVVMVQEQADFVVAKSAGGGAPVVIRLVTCSHCGRSHQRDGETRTSTHRQSRCGTLYVGRLHTVTSVIVLW
jgi:hypothetical protein